jgi:ParB family transcriptional regulator, chromosome partitioning protein
MNLSALHKAQSITAPRTNGVSPFMELELHNIYPNPDQPRKHFDPETLRELSESIRTNGLIQPIAVAPRGAKYMIISGERRFQACKILGLKTIKAHVLIADEKIIQELALVENIQRDDLTDFEKAKFIGQLWASGHYKQKGELAKAIGKSSAYISKAFSCLKLDTRIVSDIEEAKHDIGLSVLEEIGRIRDRDVQFDIYKMYVSGELKRDDFKETLLERLGEKREKISRGENANFDKEIWGMGEIVVSQLLKYSFDPKKNYKIIIKEF